MSDWFGDFLKSQYNPNEQTDWPDFTASEHTLNKFIPSKTLPKDDFNDENARQELIKTLKNQRKIWAEEKSLPLYCIFSNAVIEELAMRLPADKTTLSTVKGIGKTKIEQHGNKLLEIIQEFCAQHADIKPSYTLSTKKAVKLDLPDYQKEPEAPAVNEIYDENFVKIKEAIKAGKNVFVTGSAGTGKSFILNNLKKEFNFEVTSTTGMAAVNIGGQTIHAWAGVGICNLPVDAAVKGILKKTNLAKRIRNTKILAIDEISMLDASTFDYLNNVLKVVRACSKPFGGLQVILFGDFFQLPPVEKSNGFCFEAAVWKELNPENILLKKIYRQSDGDFANILNNIRQNNLKNSDLDAFFARNNLEIPADKEILHIFATNEAADNFNTQKFNALNSKPQELYAKDILMKNEEADKIVSSTEEAENLSIARKKIWDTLDKYCKAPQKLVLKKGCRVMLLKNLDFEQGLINGSCGVVREISQDGVTINFDNGYQKAIKPQEFEYSKDGKLLAKRVQYPLRLAYGITIHKSQGMTLDEVFIDFNRIFEYGQAYVALSRVKSLNGLYLKGFDPRKIMANPKIVEFYAKLERENCKEPV